MEDDNSKQRWYFRVIFFFLLLHESTGFQDCSSAVIGVADSNIIPDSSFTASSELRAEYGADKARFISNRCWEPNGNDDADDYLQIDLGKVFVICAVATKGNPVTHLSEWTEEYKISTSVDGTTWTWYQNNNIKTFTGNADKNTEVKNVLDAPVQAKFIRFTPTKFKGYKALRVELYGDNFYSEAFSCNSLPVGLARVAKIPDNKMTSSSNFNTSTPSSNARLGYTAGSSWCSATSASSPYLQVDLGKSYIICGVATQGDHKSRQWVQTYQMQTSSDGTSFTDYHKENNIIKVFPGNTDSNTIVQNPLFDGVVGQYVRIQPKSSFGSTTCMRTELYGAPHTVCSKIFVGVASPALVPNHRFTASSYFDNRYVPSNARLRLNRAWEPANQPGSWLHIDLGSVVYVCAVATQGNALPAVEYAKKYKLRLSLDNVNWQYYQENNVDKVFIGNINKDDIVTNTLAVPTKAKFLGFYPTDYAGYPAMRVEVYGVPVVCGKAFGLEKGGNLGNIRVTASSKVDDSHNASHGRLYGDASWCSSTSSNSEYIQIDFGKLVTLTGIATQGDHTDDKWVKTYILEYSIDGSQWNDYRESGNIAKVFQGNSNKSSIVVRWLNHPITAQYIRIYPQTWNNDICMRLELFGCSSPSTLKISELSNKNLTAASGRHVTLTCKVQEPLVQSIEWLSDDKDVTDISGGITRDATSVKSSLLVNYTSAADVFTNTRCSKEARFVICRRNIVCKVRYTKDSVSGDSIQGAEVQIRLDYPSAPLLSSISNTLTDSVEIYWTTSIKGSQSVDQFVIKYWNHTTTNAVNATQPLRRYTVTGLLACTHYNVSIKAVGALGEGPWSNTLNFRTKSEFPKAPFDVKVTPNTSQSLRVEWQVPTGIRCPSNGSRISFSTSNGGPWTKELVNGGQTTSYDIQSLGKWTEYYIKVEVGNEKGYGAPSGTVKGRTAEDKPDAAPRNFKATATSSTSIRLTWDFPEKDKRNGVIRGFRISYCKTNGCPQRITEQLGKNSTFWYHIDGLQMYAKYSFKILAYTSVGDGPYSNDIKERTLEGPPSEPRDIETGDIAPDGSSGPRLQVSWKMPSSLNAEYIRKYSVSYKADGLNVINKTLNDNKTTTILDVCGGVKYVISVWARTVADGDKARTDVTTKIHAPMTVPSGLKSDEHNTSTFNISWMPIPSTEGRIVVYELSVLGFNSTAKLWNLQKFLNVTCPEVACRGSAKHRCGHILHNLPQCAKFNLTVRPYTDEGHGKFSEAFTLETSVPGPSRKLKAEDIGKNSVKLTWLEPQPLAKPVTKYTIKYSGKKDYHFDGEEKLYGENESRETSLTITNLYPATNYRFIVSAATECADKGQYSEPAFARTETGAPPAPTEGAVSTISGTVANITLWKISAINGLIREILVFVENVQSGQKRRRSVPDCEAKANQSFKLDASKRVFILGDGKKYRGKENKELSQGEEYEVYQCGVTRNKQKPLYGEMVMIAEGKVPITDDKSTQSGNPGGSNTPLVASLVVVFLVIIIVSIIVGVIFWRKRRNNESNDDMRLNNMDDIQQKNRDVIEREDVSTHANAGYVHNDNGNAEVCDDENADLYGNAEAIRHQPIAANKFNQYVNERADSLKDEFKLLSSGQLFPWTAAKDPKNKPKNRYANIITYDHSRVVLQDTSNGSDYVNASYIHGFDGTPRTYIATQGPNPVSVPDFWQMVWQENIKTIVMLTNLIEAGKVKCHQYWPDKKDTYGKFTISLHRTDTMADYVVRVLIVCKDGETESRQVYHFQYISWPDKGVPQHATSVLGFRRKARSHYSSCSSTAPLLVHCSAGVGRTGAFLAVDAMMEKVKKEKTIDIFNYVQLMRDNRSTMVQTEEQYVFVHRALQEAITCGNTEIPVLNLNIAMGKLAKPRPKDQQTGYESEWKRLTAISPRVTNEMSKAGRQHNNRPRNRYQDIIPFDSSRVFLSQEQQNYINASFANAFRERNAFIMTQAPLMNTVSDFWHMIHQYKIGSIVMLNTLEEENESFLQYWPKKGSETYNGFTVEVIKKMTSGPLVITKCILTHSENQNNPHNFVHIQHTDWPKGGAPNNCQSILDIVDRVQKAQQQSCNAPIAVQCSDGVGRSGTFCAVYSIIERVKSEQVVDVFQAIKVLRLGRPNAVATLEQYKFCYKMVQTYLDSFNDYANFSEV